MLLLKGRLNWLVAFYRKQNGSVRAIIITVMIIFLWMVSGLIFPSKDNNIEQIAKSLKYRTIQSKAQVKESIFNISGVASSKKKVQLVAESSGTVEKIFVDMGSFVKKGSPILAIEVKNKKELYEKAISKLNQSKIEFKSTSMLYQKKLASEIDLAKSQSNLSSAEADLKQAEIEYLNAQVIAPFDGYIDNIDVNEGDYVSLNSMGVKSEIGTFIAAEPMVIKSEIADAKVQFIKVGYKAVIKTFNDIEKEGVVASISRVMNDTTNSFPIEISIINKDFQIRHGQAVSVKILMEEQLAHKLPQSVLILHNDVDLGVKILDDMNTVQFYKVNIIDEEAGYVWLSGLPEDINIITLGHIYLNVGDKVEVAEGQRNQR